AWSRSRRRCDRAPVRRSRSRATQARVGPPRGVGRSWHWQHYRVGVSIVNMRSRFVDRQHAGAHLADAVATALGPTDPTDVIVLGLPRGGVPAAARVAPRLGAVLDVLAVRKIGTPGHVELAIGAIASGGLIVRNDELVAQLGLSARTVERRVGVARKELAG